MAPPADFSRPIWFFNHYSTYTHNLQASRQKMLEGTTLGPLDMAVFGGALATTSKYPSRRHSCPAARHRPAPLASLHLINFPTHRPAQTNSLNWTLFCQQKQDVRRLRARRRQPKPLGSICQHGGRILQRPDANWQPQ